MCLQCVVEAEEVIREVIPGYSLYVSQNDQEPKEWPKGWYGLVHINDPDIVFECDFSIEGDEFPREAANTAYEYFYMSPFHGHRFLEACKEVGYNPEKDGWNVSIWFLERVRDMIKYEHPNPEIRFKEF